jgi:hypothetical protein
VYRGREHRDQAIKRTGRGYKVRPISKPILLTSAARAA